MTLGSTYLFVFKFYGTHRDLHVLTPSSPTRRSPELADWPRHNGHAIAGRLCLEQIVNAVNRGLAWVGNLARNDGAGLLCATVGLRQAYHPLDVGEAAGATTHRAGQFLGDREIRGIQHHVEVGDRKSTRLNSSH